MRASNAAFTTAPALWGTVVDSPPARETLPPPRAFRGAGPRISEGESRGDLLLLRTLRDFLPGDGLILGLCWHEVVSGRHACVRATLPSPPPLPPSACETPSKKPA